MPELQITSEPIIEHVVLPTYTDQPEADQAWVDIDVSPMTGADMDVYDEDSTDGNKVISLTFRLLAERIKKWNFTYKDAAGTDQPTPITAENVRHLNITDFSYLNKIVRTKSSTGPGIGDPAKKV